MRTAIGLIAVLLAVAAFLSIRAQMFKIFAELWRDVWRRGWRG